MKLNTHDGRMPLGLISDPKCSPKFINSTDGIVSVSAYCYCGVGERMFDYGVGMGLTRKQKLAIESLFHKAEEEVATSVGVRKETLRRWKSQPEFAAALAARSREIRAAAARILSMSSLTAAEKLKALIDSSGPETKTDPKILLDALKASGLFDAVAEPEEGVTLDQLIAEATRMALAEDTDGGDGSARED